MSNIQTISKLQAALRDIKTSYQFKEINNEQATNELKAIKKEVDQLLKNDDLHSSEFSLVLDLSNRVNKYLIRGL